MPDLDSPDIRFIDKNRDLQFAQVDQGDKCRSIEAGHHRFSFLGGDKSDNTIDGNSDRSIRELNLFYIKVRPGPVDHSLRQSAVIFQLAFFEFQFLISQINLGFQHFQFFFRLIQNGGGDKTFLVQFLIALQHFLRQLDLNQQFLALRHGLVNFQRTLGEYF